MLFICVEIRKRWNIRAKSHVTIGIVIINHRLVALRHGVCVLIRRFASSLFQWRVLVTVAALVARILLIIILVECFRWTLIGALELLSTG